MSTFRTIQQAGIGATVAILGVTLTMLTVTACGTGGSARTTSKSRPAEQGTMGTLRGQPAGTDAGSQGSTMGTLRGQPSGPRATGPTPTAQESPDQQSTMGALRGQSEPTVARSTPPSQGAQDQGTQAQVQGPQAHSTQAHSTEETSTMRELRSRESQSTSQSTQAAAQQAPAHRAEGDTTAREARTQERKELGEQRAVQDATESHIPGNRIINGRIMAIKGKQLQVDIGNPKPLYLPLKPGTDKDMMLREGDEIVITMNDHNAVVDYHPKGQRHAHDHDVIRGQLAQPLTVGFDKAVIRTEDGDEHSYWISSQARAKLGAIPVGADAMFLRDETDQIVDAQLANFEGQHAGRHQKGRVKGAHQQVQAIFKGTESNDRIKVAVVPGQDEQVMPIRPPLEKLDRLKEDQNVVLLLDDEGYVVEIATPDVAPSR